MEESKTMRTFGRTRLSALSLLLVAWAMLLAPAAFAEGPRRVLHVSLYPYIPEPEAAALTLKQAFERQHPDVIVDVTFNRNYYSLDPADKGVLYEDADVHEIDVVFLSDFIARHKLAPLSPALAASLDSLEPLARQAATVDGRLVAAPQWMCADFLIYRADQVRLPAQPTLADLEQAFGSGRGLLMNLKGPDALGELYMSAMIAKDGSPDAALAHMAASPAPDPAILDRLRRILALEPGGFGRVAAYGEREEFYARQFARGAGAAFFGYSEMTHEALEEGALCRIGAGCVTAAGVDVAAFPYVDGRTRPNVWVDMFGVDARVHGQRRKDAEAFIRYAVSLPAFRALLIPQAGQAPRYLLPATTTAFGDPQILAAAPLYPKFHAIMQQGGVVSAPDLGAKLHQVAAQIDAALPPTH